MKTIDFKKELIAKYEEGVHVSELAREYGMAKLTISTILKNKDAIKATDVAKGSFLISKQKPQIIEVEKLLLIYINETQLAEDSVSEATICKKAKEIHSSCAIFYVLFYFLCLIYCLTMQFYV